MEHKHYSKEQFLSFGAGFIFATMVYAVPVLLVPGMRAQFAGYDVSPVRHVEYLAPAGPMHSAPPVEVPPPYAPAYGVDKDKGSKDKGEKNKDKKDKDKDVGVMHGAAGDNKCANGIDDDEDGPMDIEDDDCDTKYNGKDKCDDGRDNDKDRFVDMEDIDCDAEYNPDNK